MTQGGQGIMFDFAARSNTGLVRKNNQDSGYAGPNFLLIADGMGGHAGGDVASAITVSRLADLDEADLGQDALERLRTSILDANERISNSVVEKPELAGMGTTVTALLRAGDRLALAHIGDSRGFLLRDGVLTQVTADHTFVQMLVDEGRITPEEAEHHPQRSVVMKVLGDVGAAPELDLSIRDTRVGDRWMLCSDGLTGFASHEDILEALTAIDDPGRCCEKLVDLALAGGGADNVTVVIGDVVEATPAGEHELGESVGSVRINPHFALLGQRDRPTELIDTGGQRAVGSETPTEAIPDDEILAAEAREDSAAGDALRASEAGELDGGAALAAGGATAAAGGAADNEAAAAADAEAAGDSAAEAPPGSRRARRRAERAAEERAAQQTAADAGAAGHDGTGERRSRAERRADCQADSEAAHELGAPADGLDEDLDDEPRPRRRALKGLLAALVVVAVIGVAGLLGWNFVRSQYYVSNDGGYVTVYRGVSQKIGPVALSRVEDRSDIQVTGLSSYSQHRLEETIPAGSKESAEKVVGDMRRESEANSQRTGIQPGASDATESPDPAPSSPVGASADAGAGA
ncbi:protein phosphatase 2C domain-containing protein [Brevibacterium sp. BRM-1]|uniref:PP2C family protein-serine/threonine phosphatase n=1 Tax=Brevibacterium sp. BRM-1 TaxID=2999062 RepID=UPI0022805C7D|nr:PP2C family serine/threonine-protein phosphatase [Brevibacterium sp. BRM-1]WAL39662.1 protein phosphatase 2C domain-containing protein [Brevibacterium sp. BRM-1]